MLWSSSKTTKGTLADRPWAETLATIATARRSVQITLKSEGKVFQLAFSNGALVGAVSPVPADIVQRIALANHLLPPASIAAAVRNMGRSDNVEKFAEAAGLLGDAAVRFKQRVLIQRAARSFAAERGNYVIDERITMPVLSHVEVDVRAVIYRGMRMMHPSEVRLAQDLRQLGARFILFPEAMQFLDAFELDAEAAPIVAALREGTSIPELEALHRELDPRLICAVLGALATCNVITPIDATLANVQAVAVPRAPTERPSTTGTAMTRAPAPSRADVDLTQGLARGTKPGIVAQHRAKQLIGERLAMLRQGADLFAFLGVPFGAPVPDVRAAFVEIARYLRPERLAELGIHDDRDEARTVFAQAVLALTTLTDLSRRARYVSAVASKPRN